jgi:hypothetical protein
MLVARGFTVLDRHRGAANQGGDLTGAVYLAINRVAPPLDVPWRPPSTAARRAHRAATLTAALPVLAAAAALDRSLGALARGGVPLSNAYRILARLDV